MKEISEGGGGGLHYLGYAVARLDGDLLRLVERLGSVEFDQMIVERGDTAPCLKTVIAPKDS